ncbi:MAG TPA: response regulator [Stellaceae bacterium]|nr:response regulator [Stellaceae bacterium]
MREGRRILIVEDDYLIATLLAEVLETAGWRVVGPVGQLGEAVDAAVQEKFDAAVLDVNLGGKAVYPVAAVLDERHVPFVFLTGYGAETLQRPFCGRPRLGKPFKTAELLGTVARLVDPAAGA